MCGYLALNTLNANPTRGLITTYGAFQEYYQTTLLPDQPPSSLSWVGSIQATLIVMVGIVTGPLVDSGWLRPLIVCGSFLTVFGIMMTSLSTQYYQVRYLYPPLLTSGLTLPDHSSSRIRRGPGRRDRIHPSACRDFLLLHDQATHRNRMRIHRL